MKKSHVATARAAALACPLCLPDALLREPVPDRPVLLVRELAPGIFGVGAADGERIVTVGTWIETLRLEAPTLDPGPLRPPGIDLAVTAGVLVDSTGSIQPAFALDVKAAWGAPSGPGPLEALIPLGPAADAEDVAQRARDLYAQLCGAAPALAGGEPPFEFDPCRCKELFDGELQACKEGLLACNHFCDLLVFGAIDACAGAGPPDPECIWEAIGGFMPCRFKCLVAYAACLNIAVNRFIECGEQCPSPLASDHGN